MPILWKSTLRFREAMAFLGRTGERAGAGRAQGRCIVLPALRTLECQQDRAGCQPTPLPLQVPGQAVWLPRASTASSEEWAQPPGSG